MIPSLGKQEEAASEWLIQGKNREEQCLEISCNIFYLYRHINLEGLNKVSASKELRIKPREGSRTDRANIVKSTT
jgi:hypothetical protein